MKKTIKEWIEEFPEPLDLNEYIDTKLDEFTKKGIEFYFESYNEKKLICFKSKDPLRTIEFKTIIFDKSEEPQIIQAVFRFAEEFLKIINH